MDESIAVFEMNAEGYPKSPNTYDSLADAYRTAGRLEDALRGYERAVELAEQSKDSRLAGYRSRLARAKREVTIPRPPER